jgi:hypothetical protein
MSNRTKSRHITSIRIILALTLGSAAVFFGMPLIHGLISPSVSAQTESKADHIVPPAAPAPKKEERARKAGDSSGNLINATTYAFTSSAGNVLEDMSSGTTLLIVADGDDTNSTVAPIGFDFWFDGIRQNNFSANANGIMRLSATAISGTNFSNDLAANTLPSIVPYWDDIWIGNNGKVHYKVVGTAPTRKLVVEWQNEQVPRVAGATSGAGTFQAWLYESSGAIEFVYGSGMAINAAQGGYTVGFGTSATQFASITTAGPTAAYGTSNNSQTGAITAGTKYTFTPATPTAPSVAPEALTFTAVGLNTMTLNWTDNATNELGYVISRSFDGTTYEFIRQIAAGSTSSIEGGLASNTTYFWRVQAVTEGSLSSALSASQATTTGTLSGTRTIGPTGNYLSIGAAVTDINTVGLAGNLVLELQATYLSTAETFPIAINSVGSPLNVITLRPASGATGLSIAGLAATQTLNLNGAAFWNIDGRAGGAGVSQLTVSNTSVAGVPVQFINDTRNTLLQYLTVAGVNTSATGGDIVFSTTTGPIGNSFNAVDNCDIKDGATTPANGIFSLGTAGVPNTNNTISNNLIHDNFVATTTPNNGILLSSAAGNLSNVRWNISNNKFYQSVTRTFITTGAIHAAIRIGQDTGSVVTGYGHTVSGNTIGYASSSATGTYTMAGTIATRFIGINVNAGAEPTSIQNNTVTAFSLATSSGATTTNGVFSGINILQGNANIGTTTGNTIGGTGTGHITTTPTTTLALNVGVSVHTNTTGVAAVNISNNTIGGFTANGSGSISGIAMSVGQATITNNIIGNNATALSMNSPAVAATSTLLNGINVAAGTAPAIITGNTIANFSGAGTGTTAVGRGIVNASTGPATVTGNTIHDIASGSTNTTVAGGGTAVQGILQTGAAALGANVSQNTIFTLSATNTGAVQTNVVGIGYSNPSNGTVTRNKIYDMRNASTMAVATTPPTAGGILIRAALGTGGTFANNMISVGTAQTTNTQFFGLWNSFVTNTITIHYNSVHIGGTATAGALPSHGFLRGDNTAASAITTVVDIRNNIFNNTRTGGTGKHYAIGNVNTVPATGWSATASNNNALNSAAAGTVGIWGLALDRDFANWKISSGGDGASISGVPVTFVDAANGDLHVNFGVTPTQLESGGTVVAITTDFDNQTRPGPAGSVNGGATAPDIGADEFDGVPLDLSGPVITYTPFSNTTQTTDRTLSVTITDNVAVAGAGLAPRIYYRKNGVPAGYTSNQCGAPTGNVYPCTILNAGIGGVTAGDVIEYFVVAQDNAGNVSSNPSTGFSATTVNIIITPPTTPNSYTIIAGFAASVNVGSGETYTSLTNNDAAGLFKALNSAVLIQNLTINITSDLTIETGAIALNAPAQELVMAPPYSILIKPTGAPRTITTTGAATNLLKFNGVSNLTIDGSLAGGTDRSLTIENASVSATSAVVFGSVGTTPITNDTLKNTIVRNGVNTSSAVIISDSGTVGNAGFFSDITIQNNDVQRAFVGVFATGGTTPQNGSNLIYTGNTINTAGANAIRSVGLYMQGVNGATVTNNTLANFNAANDESDAGIWLATGTINATVSGNAITALNYSGTGGFSPVGINVTSGAAASNNLVSRNSVTAMTSGGSSSTAVVSGISVSGAATGGITIERNNVGDIGNTNPSTWPAIGINLGGGNNNVLRNNFVYRVYNDQVAGTGAFSPQFGVSGIRLNSGTGHQVYNNSVHLFGVQSGSVSTNLVAALAVFATTVTGADIRNNALSNQMTGGNLTGGSTRFAAIALPSGGTSAMNLTLNNNAYYEGTHANDRMAVVGTTSGTGDFAAAAFNPGSTAPATNFRSYSSTLSAAGTNDNASQALITAPPFVSNTDLHIVPVNSLMGAGVPIGSVTVDYDNDPRPASNPDIGADEMVEAVTGTIPAGTYYNVYAANNNLIGGNTTVTGTLWLGGLLSGNSSTLTLGCNATVEGEGPFNYFILGNFEKEFCGTGVFTFPVGTFPDNALADGASPEGNPSEYTPLDATITAGTFPAGNPPSLTVSVTDTFLPGVVQSNAVSRYWTVEESGDLTADMVFHYLDPLDVNGNEALYKVFKYTTGPFATQAPPPNSVDTVNNLLMVGNVTSFSDWGGAAAAPTASTASISGRVTTANGNGIRNAAMILTGNSLPAPVIVQTGSFGTYSFDNLRVGETYILQVGAKRFRFTNPTHVITLQGSITDMDFIANPQE